MKTNPIRIAIIGGGPRGLSCLEALAERLAGCRLADPIEIVVFESSRYPGCGPNYAPDQVASNQLNIPLREIPLSSRAAVNGPIACSAFPGFRDWYLERVELSEQGQDHYPPRAEVGRYLQARFEAIVHANNRQKIQSDGQISARLEIAHEQEVTSLRHLDDRWQLQADGALVVPGFDEVLLSIGHQPTETDPALESWSERGIVYKQPYPNDRLRDADSIQPDTTVAIRGLGLSMIDVVKSLTLGRGGRLVMLDEARLTMRYERSGNEPRLMLPFSLDGLPLAPKPISERVDSRFAPDAASVEMVRKALTSAWPIRQADELLALMIELVACVGVSVFLKQQSHFAKRITADSAQASESEQSMTSLARAWLSEQQVEHPLIVDTAQSAPMQMAQFLAMATGHRTSSLDYCIGQVWRHLQPVFFEALRFRGFDGVTIVKMLALHQRMKRYSFGPPALAVATLLALVEAGLLKFRVAADPDIQVRGRRWLLRDGDDCEEAQVMINTVLDSPVLESTCSPLVQNLRRSRLVAPVHEDLGAGAARDGRLSNGLASPDSLCGAGRLITGSIVEADALDSCFGDEPGFWADGVIDRLSKRGTTLKGLARSTVSES